MSPYKNTVSLKKIGTQLLFADSINITQSGNFKSVRKFWDLKQRVDWMYKLTGFLFLSSDKQYFGL